MGVWNVATPVGADNAREGDDRIREMKVALEEALQAEGSFPGSAPTTAPKFKWTGKRGNTAGRPAAPVTGEIYFNTQTATMEYWSGAVWTAYDLVPALGITTAKIADANVTADKIAAAVAGDGLTGGAGSPLAVNPDGVTIETNSDALRVKDAGISITKLSSDLVKIFSYKRPVLKFISVTTVDVENNTGTLNQTRIVFPDGTVREVTEDTSSTNKYRRFLITAAAEFTSGTEDSGVRSGISEAVSTWYAIYAVKSAIDATKFVLAGDTTLPLQTNFSTLNSRYGTSGWVYLGMIRNGDNDAATGDILNFVQNGNRTDFKSAVTTFLGLSGILEGGGAEPLTYNYAAGTGTGQIPDHLTIAKWGYSLGAAATTSIEVTNPGGTLNYFFGGTGDEDCLGYFHAASSEGIKVASSTGAGAAGISFAGFIDSVLGVGANPIL